MIAVAAQRNTRVALAALGVAAGMVALAYASVPLYRLFCQVTGFGGTTQIASAAPGASTDASLPTMVVRFDASVARGMPWRFVPVQRSVRVRLGEETLAVYRATNTTARSITGQATFNVVPVAAGRYFNKIECFCFTEQTLAPGESVDMPVSFFVDSDIVNDRELRNVNEITLSYTFFRTGDDVARPTTQ